VVALGACGGRAFDPGAGGEGGDNQSGSGGSHAGTSHGGTSYGGSSAGAGGGVVGGSGGSTNPYACMQRSDCTLAPASCCGVCDGPGLTKDAFVAYNRFYGGGSVGCGFVSKTLPNPGGAGYPGPGATPPASGGSTSDIIACPDCAAPLPGQGTIQNFLADCQAGQCVVMDLRESNLTTCTQNSQCVLRAGTGCCAGCGSDWVAVRDDGSFTQWACNGLELPCDACAGAPPPGLVAWCAPSGHCETAMQMPTPAP
jgi:hypothetical protein